MTVFLKENSKVMLRSSNFVKKGFEDRKEIINGCQSHSNNDKCKPCSIKVKLFVFTKVFIKYLYDRKIRVSGRVTRILG